MAITKLPRGGLADSAVTSAKVADTAIGTAEIPDSEITSAKLADDAVTNAKLANSAITIRGTPVSLGGSHTVNIDVDWQTVKTGNTTMVAGQGYFVNTTSDAVTMTLPSSASRGDTVAIKDYAGTFGSNNCTIARNGHNIQGNANDSTLSTNRATFVLVYADSTKGWLYTVESNVSDFGPKYNSATGGTVTTSGDFKIHTFTGDGNFVVSSAGNDVDSGDILEYIVVAGGGGGGRAGNSGAGGGGAGGFRFASPSLSPVTYPAKPLAAPSGLTVAVQTYPITVGAGGSGGPGPSNNPGLAAQGSNSVFSTITSAGGGKGGGNTSTSDNANGTAGGSGGAAGTSGNQARSGGAGNTPPVSPAQGTDGGDSFDGNAPFNPASSQGGGGGGALTAGTDRTSSTSSLSAAPGGTGAGVPSAFGTSGESSGGFYHFAGGGGGASRADYIYPSVPTNGGLGGGGNGGSAVGCGILANPSMNATANTGGGGGGGASSTDNPASPGPGYAYHWPGVPLNAAGGSGGSGIVIIRYKYQN